MMSDKTKSFAEQLSEVRSKTKPLSSDSPFFVMTEAHSALHALRFFLRENPFSSIKSGWKDKKGQIGITLLNSEEKKCGVIICKSQAAETLALNEINKILED